MEKVLGWKIMNRLTYTNNMVNLNFNVKVSVNG